MAKKKLFGNHIEPSCETCAIGMVSSDGESVLCRYAGAPSKYHHCKRFRYDPLKRTPRRQAPPAAFTAADFSLDDPTEELITARPTEEPVDPAREAMRSSLRSYLDGTDSPSADDILELLSVSSPTEESETEELLREAEELLAQAPVEEETVIDAEEMLPELPQDDVEEETKDVVDEPTEDPMKDDTPADEPDVVTEQEPTDDEEEELRFTALASEEAIRRDMEQFSVERHEGASTRAAFDTLTVHFHSDDGEDEPLEAPVEDNGPDPTLLFDPGNDDEDEEGLLSDDLLFLDLDDLSGETIEALKLNDDGSLSTSTEDL